MQIIKKIFLLITLLWAALANSTNFPNQPVKIIVAFSAGSAPDVLARRTAELLTEKWKTPVLIENKPGGGGSVALAYVNKQPADGYTIGYFDSGAIIFYPLLYNKLSLVNDIEVISGSIVTPLALTVSTDIHDYKEFLNEINKNNSYGSWNTGSPAHIAGAEFAELLGSNPIHIAYKDYATMYSDISAKRIIYTFSTFGSAKPLRDAGKIHHLAILASKRDSNWPDLPTIKELTGKDIIPPPVWLMFFISKNTPLQIKKTLEIDLKEVATTTRIAETLNILNYNSIGSWSLNELNQKINQDTENYKQLVKKFNISVE